jgi:hypothetical protein
MGWSQEITYRIAVDIKGLGTGFGSFGSYGSGVFFINQEQRDISFNWENQFSTARFSLQ